MKNIPVSLILSVKLFCLGVEVYITLPNRSVILTVLITVGLIIFIKPLLGLGKIENEFLVTGLIPVTFAI
jgi:hypothetical protein